MVNYQTAKIYKIVNDINDKIYIGSTCNELRYRMYGHRNDSKKERNTNPMYKDMKDNCEKFRILLVENFPCENKQQLEAREYEIIQQHKKELGRGLLYNLILDNPKKSLDRNIHSKHEKKKRERLGIELRCMKWLIEKDVNEYGVEKARRLNLEVSNYIKICDNKEVHILWPSDFSEEEKREDDN